MAGTPIKRQRREEESQIIAALEAEIRELKARIPHDTYTVQEAKTLTPDTREGLIRDMLAMADEGLSLEEISSQWNVTLEVVRGWMKGDVAFNVAAQRARTRGKAATMAMLRALMSAGRGVPGAFADRMMAMHSDSASEGVDASSLIRIDVADDAASCPHCGIPLAAQGDRQTVDESDGG